MHQGGLTKGQLISKATVDLARRISRGESRAVVISFYIAGCNVGDVRIQHVSPECLVNTFGFRTPEVAFLTFTIPWYSLALRLFNKPFCSFQKHLSPIYHIDTTCIPSESSTLLNHPLHVRWFEPVFFQREKPKRRSWRNSPGFPVRQESGEMSTWTTDPWLDLQGSDLDGLSTYEEQKIGLNELRDDSGWGGVDMISVPIFFREKFLGIFFGASTFHVILGLNPRWVDVRDPPVEETDDWWTRTFYLRIPTIQIQYRSMYREVVLSTGIVDCF